MAYGKIKADSIIYDNSGSDVEKTIASLAADTEGTAVKSTGESGTTKFLRVDGDGTCSWQVPPDTNTQLTNEAVQDLVGAMVTGNTETGIAVTYEDGDGTLDFVVGTLNQDTTGTAAIATSVTVADESSDTTCFPLFVTAATGNLAPKSGTNITFNSSTGLLSATAVTTTGNVVVGGNLQVDGTTTTVNSSTMTVTDKNIEIAKGAANDAAADGAGITVDSGGGDKTWNWVDATDAWTSSEHIHLGDNKKFLAGTGTDLEIFHNGTNSRVANNTGELRVESDTIRFRDADYGDTYCNMIHDGAVELYHDNSKKIETTAAGVTVTGSVTDDKGDVRKIPFDSNTGQTTLTTAMVGKVVSSNTGWTIPASTFAAGDAITLVNNNAATKTITATALTALYNGVDGANVKASTLTLGVRSMATIWFETHDHCYIQASALTVS